MAHGQASERLRELQELMDADNQALARDLDAGPSDTSPEPHSSPFRVSQSGGPRSWKERLQALKVRPVCVIQASELAPAVVPAAYWCSTVACSAAAHIPLPRVSSAIPVGIPANRAAKLGYHSRLPQWQASCCCGYCSVQTLARRYDLQLVSLQMAAFWPSASSPCQTCPGLTFSDVQYIAPVLPYATSRPLSYT